MFDIPKWSMISNPYHAETSNKHSLVITVGDSWTYGDSLGGTRVRDGIDDTDHRLRHVYGSLIARETNSDWINLALPGTSNTMILRWLGYLLPTIVHKNVVCIITLTESGRHEDTLDLQQHPTQQAALVTMVNNAYNQINQFKLQYPKIKFVVAHNFTDPVPNDLTCERSWLEVLLDKTIDNGTHLVVSDYIGYMNSSQRYPDVLDIIERANQRVTLLDNCVHCNKQDTRHPTEQGHTLWSRYLMAQF